MQLTQEKEEDWTRMEVLGSTDGLFHVFDSSGRLQRPRGPIITLSPGQISARNESA